MANSVYNTVCDALSGIVSRRAAENIVREALKNAKTDPNRVTALEMQSLLKSAVFARLQQIIPVAQAKGEIKQILTRLEKSFSPVKAPVLTPEVLEGLTALQAEFRPYAKLSQPRAQRLRGDIQALPNSSDPVKALNTLWAELDLLQLELSGRTPPAPLAPPIMTEDLMLSSGEFALSYEFDEILEAELPISAPSISALSSAAVSSTVVSSTAVANTALSSTALSSTVPITPLEIAPTTATAALTRQPPATRPVIAPDASTTPATNFDLETGIGREALLSHFALEEGVVGVLLTDRLGTVLASRLSSGDEDHLAAVVAVTTLLLEKHRAFKLFYTHLAEVSAFIGSAGKYLLTVLSDDRVNVGRILSAMASLEEDV